MHMYIIRAETVIIWILLRLSSSSICDKRSRNNLFLKVRGKKPLLGSCSVGSIIQKRSTPGTRPALQTNSLKGSLLTIVFNTNESSSQGWRWRVQPLRNHFWDEIVIVYSARVSRLESKAISECLFIRKDLQSANKMLLFNK